MFTIKFLVFLLVPLIINCDEIEEKFGDYIGGALYANISVPEDFGLDIYKFLRKYNYSFETHYVRTEDDYILRMQRVISRHPDVIKIKNKPAVLLQHGLLSSAMDFVNMGPNKSLALVLADAGFDVWLGNNRGNTWSRLHVTLDPDIDKAFWNYSFETCGQYDLPAKIDHIIEETGQPKIFYVGHSQGTTQFFAMSALRPEYNDKIALMTALAPVAYMSHCSSLLPRLMAKYLSVFESIAQALGWNEILGHSKFLSETSKLFCSDNSPTQEMCAVLLFTMFGFNSPQLNRTLMPVLTSNAPAGISLKMVLHFMQEITSGKFRRYDYGTALNLKYYNSPEPPLFDISAVTAPIALYYSENDLLAAVQDVESFAKELPNLVQLRKIESKLFNHLDFIFAKNTNELINLPLIDLMREVINGTIPTSTPAPVPGGNRANDNVVSSLLFVITLIVGIFY